MSYILEALKKSESERNQGRVPHLGQQMRMVHRKRKRGIPAAVWVAIALTLNAALLAALFWPGVGLWWDDRAVSVPVQTSDRGAAAQALPGQADPQQASGTRGEIARAEEAVPDEAEITAATGELESQGAVILDTRLLMARRAMCRSPGKAGCPIWWSCPWRSSVRCRIWSSTVMSTHHNQGHAAS